MRKGSSPSWCTCALCVCMACIRCIYVPSEAAGDDAVFGARAGIAASAFRAHQGQIGYQDDGASTCYHVGRPRPRYVGVHSGAVGLQSTAGKRKRNVQPCYHPQFTFIYDFWYTVQAVQRRGSVHVRSTGMRRRFFF